MSSNASSPEPEINEQSTSDTDVFDNMGRRLIEEKLRQKRYVQHFSTGNPGAILNDEEVQNYGYNAYTNHANIYAPFSSALDWDVARWIKLRGPESNASTELLQIPEVRMQP